MNFEWDVQEKIGGWRCLNGRSCTELQAKCY